MKYGPYETGKVYHGDCLELIKELPDSCVPLVWTDPPYGCNQNDKGDLASRASKALNYRRGNESAGNRAVINDSKDDTERVIRGMLEVVAPKMSPDCAINMCCGGGGPVPMFCDVVSWLSERPWTFFHAVVWDKGGLGMGWRYRRNYEFVMVGHLHGGKLKWETESKGLDTANIVRINGIKPKSTDHQTPKPVSLVEHFLRLHTNPGDLVLDPFTGGGTTGVACANLGREFIGFELDEKWVAHSNKRIEAANRGVRIEELATGQMTIFDIMDAPNT